MRFSKSIFGIHTDRKAIMYLILTAGGIILYNFYNFISSPNLWSLGNQSGDGLKNYFTVLHYVKYDKDLLFSGMNYPYGEYIHFIDAHPIYSVVLNFIDDHLFSIHDHLFAIINYWLLIGLIITPIVIYYLLRHFALPRNYSVIVSLIISFLSPQLDRITGHYALSYSYIIPLCWLLALKISKSKKSRYDLALGIGLIIIVSSWIHAYFAAILGMFIFAYGVISYLFSSNKKYLPIITPLVALGLSYYLLSFTDHFVDRETFPWGVYHYTSYLESLFLPDTGIWHDLLNKIINVRDVPWEGRAYVGILGLPIFVLLLYSTIKRLLGSYSFNGLIKNKLLFSSLIASLIVWLYSTAWVHRFLPEFFQLSIKPLYQFRSMGRFAWVFYFVFTVCIACILYRLYRRYRLKFPKSAKYVLFFSLVLWAFDAYNKSNYVFKKAHHKNELLLPQDKTFQKVLSQYGYKVGDFQASLPLPLNTLDTKFLWFQHQAWYFRYAMQAAYSDGLPIIGSYASRPSIHHTTALRQIYSPSWIKKRIAEGFDQRPILVIKGKEKRKYKYEDDLLSHCTFIAETEKFILLSLPITYFDYNIDSPDLLHSEMPISEIIPTLNEQEIITIPDNSPYINITYDDLDSEHHFVGPALNIELEGDTKEIKFNIDRFDKKNQVELSFWLYIDHTPIDVMELELIEYDANGELLISKPINWRVNNSIIDQWIRIDNSLKLNIRTKYLALKFKTEDCVIDEVIIKPINTDIINKRNGKIIVNNYPLEIE